MKDNMYTQSGIKNVFKKDILILNILKKLFGTRRRNFENKKNFILLTLYNMCNIYANKIIISYNYTLYSKFDI